MPNIEDLLKTFGDNENWKNRGDEWSLPWGSSEMEWIGVIEPRIQSFIPAGTILEIAPGFGRWTQFLKNLCKNLIVVDIAENCIEYCKRRFAEQTNIHFFLNDGKTLNMVEDNSIDFIFSFDSLVHVEMNVIDSYVREFSRILNPNGIAFIHHSNIGCYRREIEERGLIAHMRGTNVTYEEVIKSCEKNNLRCITQEVVNWGSTEYLIDCFSLICRKSAYSNLPYKLYQNRDFSIEVGALRRIYEHYSVNCGWKEQNLWDNARLLQDKDKLINDLLNSRSWKLTAPLRSIFRFFRTLSK